MYIYLYIYQFLLTNSSSPILHKHAVSIHQHIKNSEELICWRYFAIKTFEKRIKSVALRGILQAEGPGSTTLNSIEVISIRRLKQKTNVRKRLSHLIVI